MDALLQRHQQRHFPDVQLHYGEQREQVPCSEPIPCERPAEVAAALLSNFSCASQLVLVTWLQPVASTAYACAKGPQKLRGGLESACGISAFLKKKKVICVDTTA